MNTQGQTLLVQRNKLAETRIDAFDADAALADGEVRFRIDHFALTANNITYAVFGELMHYWQFFPAPEGWGIVPVWGYATVQASRCEGISVGQRVYGYWPTASHAVLKPGQISTHGFTDAAEHRAKLPAVYNRYRCLPAQAANAQRDQDEGLYAVLRPLFATGWLIDDFMSESKDFGASTLLISSASSKTAYATAFCLKRAPDRKARVVGITSAARLDFCRALGLYDEVISYDEVATTRPADEPSVYIDFAGNADFRRRVHQHFGDALKHSSSIGGTHHEALGSGANLPGPRPQLFFAPSQMSKCAAPPPQGIGMAEMLRRIETEWAAFIARATEARPPWITIQSHRGAEAVLKAYLETLRGGADAQVGTMLAFD